RTLSCVRTRRSKTMNPRPFSFFPLSYTMIKDLYTLPLSGSRILPPDHLSPSFPRSQRIRSPTNGLPFSSPSQRLHRGSGSLESGSMSFSIRPYSLPFSSQMLTIEVALPVASSMVFHRPTGEVWAGVGVSGPRYWPSGHTGDRSIQTHRHTNILDRMTSSPFLSGSVVRKGCYGRMLGIPRASRPPVDGKC